MIKKIFSWLLNFTIIFLIVTFSPGLGPKTAFPFEEFSIVKPKPLTGALEINNHLDHAERLFEGEVPGAEHLLAADENSYYASLHNGNVVRIDGKHVTFIAKFGKPCNYPVEESICGRPLGMAIDTTNRDQLIVADAYYGIWQLNVKNGQKKQLIAPETSIGVNNPRPAKMFNGIAVAKNGDIFFSSSSSEFGMEDGAYSMFTNPSGRLIHFERKTGKISVLLDKLWFSNGVALSPNEDFVLVAETHASRIQRYWLKGEKKGQLEIFAEGLPGIPDNLTPDEDGLWVAHVVAADAEHPMLPHSLTRLPYVRKFLARILFLIEMPFKFITNLYPNPYTSAVAYKIGSFTSLSFVYPDRKTIVRMDWNGKIIGSLHGFDKSLGTISHVMELGDFLYLGSPYSNFIGRVWFVNKEKIHPGQKVKREATPQVTEAPKPTTTTQAPTTTTTTTTPKPTTTTTRPPTTTTTTTPKPTTTTPKPATTTQKPTTTESTTTTTTTPKPTTTTTTTPKPTTTTTTPKPATKATTTAPPADVKSTKTEQKTEKYKDDDTKYETKDDKYQKKDEKKYDDAKKEKKEEKYDDKYQKKDDDKYQKKDEKKYDDDKYRKEEEKKQDKYDDRKK